MHRGFRSDENSEELWKDVEDHFKLGAKRLRDKDRSSSTNSPRESIF